MEPRMYSEEKNHPDCKRHPERNKHLQLQVYNAPAYKQLIGGFYLRIRMIDENEPGSDRIYIFDSSIKSIVKQIK